MRRLWLASLAFLGVAALLVAVALQRLAPVAADAPAVIFVVQRGDSLSSIAGRLEQQGLVRDARAVSWLARLRGMAGQLRAGEYRLSPSASAAQILEQIAAGRVATYEVVVPEGFTAAQIGGRLAAAGLVDGEAFARAVHDPALAAEFGIPALGLEGYLFPETYRLPRNLEAAEIARVMVEQFQRAWREIAPLATARGLDMHSVVTLASIVEKETGAPEERPLIASVFANRLARHMRLESDPTVIYGIPDFDGNLQRRDLESEENPYNTYRIRGLPPGPIASPGVASLHAVVEPAQTDYLYFVSRNDGSHKFSSSYREHLEAVNTFQRRRSSR